MLTSDGTCHEDSVAALGVGRRDPLRPRTSMVALEQQTGAQLTPCHAVLALSFGRWLRCGGVRVVFDGTRASSARGPSYGAPTATASAAAVTPGLGDCGVHHPRWDLRHLHLHRRGHQVVFADRVVESLDLALEAMDAVCHSSVVMIEGVVTTLHQAGTGAAEASVNLPFELHPSGDRGLGLARCLPPSLLRVLPGSPHGAGCPAVGHRCGPGTSKVRRAASSSPC